MINHDLFNVGNTYSFTLYDPSAPDNLAPGMNNAKSLLSPIAVYVEDSTADGLPQIYNDNVTNNTQVVGYDLQTESMAPANMGSFVPISQLGAFGELPCSRGSALTSNASYNVKAHNDMSTPKLAPPEMPNKMAPSEMPNKMAPPEMPNKMAPSEMPHETTSTTKLAPFKVKEMPVSALGLLEPEKTIHYIAKAPFKKMPDNEVQQMAKTPYKTVHHEQHNLKKGVSDTTHTYSANYLLFLSDILDDVVRDELTDLLRDTVHKENTEVLVDRVVNTFVQKRMSNPTLIESDAAVTDIITDSINENLAKDTIMSTEARDGLIQKMNTRTIADFDAAIMQLQNHINAILEIVLVASRSAVYDAIKSKGTTASTIAKTTANDIATKIQNELTKKPLSMIYPEILTYIISHNITETVNENTSIAEDIKSTIIHDAITSSIPKVRALPGILPAQLASENVRLALKHELRATGVVKDKDVNKIANKIVTKMAATGTKNDVEDVVLDSTKKAIVETAPHTPDVDEHAQNITDKIVPLITHADLHIDKNEHIKKTIVETVQEETKKPVLAALAKKNDGPATKEANNEKADETASHAAHKVEDDLNKHPEILQSKDAVAKMVHDHVKEAVKEHLPVSDMDAHMVATHVTASVVNKVNSNLDKLPQVMMAHKMVTAPDMNKHTTDMANDIKGVMEGKSHMEINSEANKVILKSTNDDDLASKMKDSVHKILQPILTNKMGQLRVQKEVKSVDENTHEIKLHVKPVNDVLNTTRDAISKVITDKTLKGFSSNLPEHFNDTDLHTYVKRNGVALYDQRNLQVNIPKTIDHNILEAFEQTSQYITTKDASNDVKDVVKTVAKSNADSMTGNNIMTSAAKVASLSDGTKKVDVEVCTTCSPANTKTLTHSVASLVASKLLNKDVSEVTVDSMPGKMSHTTNLHIVATVPNTESDSDVAGTIVKSVNDASNVLMKRRHHKMHKDDHLMNLILILLIGYVAYDFFVNK